MIRVAGRTSVLALLLVITAPFAAGAPQFAHARTPSRAPTGSVARIAAPPCDGATATTVSFANPAIIPIPDATTTAQTGWGLAVSTITVSGLDPYLWDLDVQTFVPHARSNDLKMYLLAPSGRKITLTTDNNLFGYADLFNGTQWDDSALVPVTDWPFVAGQVAGPCVPEGALGAFIGDDPNGTWTLIAFDDTPANIGSIQGWSMDVTTVPFGPGLGGGSGFVNVNQVVPDAPSPGITSTILVTTPDTFLVNVTVQTNITHPSPADLSILITSPAGTTVTLSTRNGGNRDDVFNGTLWDDAAPLAATDYPYQPNVVAPFLCPDGALSAFIGENPNGLWTLTVRDDLAGDVGRLGAWSISYLTCASASPGTSFCAGDGVDPSLTTPCPCANFGGPGRGCANSVDPQGAVLTVTGTVNPDTAVLHASGMPATASAIYLKGDILADAVFGDGVRCAGGNLIRMRTRISINGASDFPIAGDPSLSVRGQTPVGSGFTAIYQTYYRNASAAFCPPATFNVTNATQIVW